MKKKRLPKNRIILLLTACALAVVCAACVRTHVSLSRSLSSQQAAERFRGEEGKLRFAQVSVFFPEDGGKQFQDIYAFRKSIGTALTTASVETDGTAGVLWKDAYSAETKLTVKGTKGSADADALGVGGDWFFFHDLKLMDGEYIREDDLMHDRVVLDETLAWKLFGGYDLAGMSVTIGGKDYLIAGVVRRESDSASAKAYTAGAGLFLYYDTLNAISETKISCYELVCAEPISGFTLDLMQKGFADAVAVQNSGRYSFSSAWKLLKTFSQRSVVSQPVVYPYWENAARMVEDRALLWRVLAAVFGAFPAGYALWQLIRALRRLWAWLKEKAARGWDDLSEAIRKRQRARIEKKSKTW